MSTNDRAHYDEARRIQERVDRLEDERNQTARSTSIAAQVGEQSAKAGEDSAKRLQSIFDLLAEQIPNLKASAASIDKRVSSIDKHMSSRNHIVKPNQNSERLIPLAGLECVSKLTRVNNRDEFY
ncbi:unnamed protein product [Tilletia controversa]|uniref:Uncharacterized protein n=3 Tax=Tilletia TaxID=13289 RepID=A0A8X7MVC4_9BASI|nr:hypothetical protein CF336_g7667 [Tilletia laevis]KAE8186309.1 hypothetical protein CF328_g7271 [Tilletia controversa]KAE8247442.1 hypothetical protein A4X03_0g7045 [Tilletia caries]KAE8187664.1 hypothetical protein CF335_g7106 [Tilletia laevis]KAE8251359.1 hypothetical protein A4X06_0g2721 [Tilletia controversa]